MTWMIGRSNILIPLFLFVTLLVKKRRLSIEDMRRMYQFKADETTSAGEIQLRRIACACIECVKGNYQNCICNLTFERQNLTKNFEKPEE